ncbi:MAG: hypothetical protein GY856_33305 [bacterium]|nr:hypothetical protein [bacterium]
MEIAPQASRRGHPERHLKGLVRVVESLVESERSGKASEAANELFRLPQFSSKRTATDRTPARPGQPARESNGEPCHAQTVAVAAGRLLVGDPAQPAEDVRGLVALAQPHRRVEHELLRQPH